MLAKGFTILNYDAQPIVRRPVPIDKIAGKIRKAEFQAIYQAKFQ
jgi:hypothetical protein